MYMYAIQSAMLSSEIAGVSFAPVDWSVTVPVIITLVPLGTTTCGAETVVALGPLPMTYMRLSKALQAVR